MTLYFCLKTDSWRSVVWHPREIPERSCFRVVSRKSGMYRYSYTGFTVGASDTKGSSLSPLPLFHLSHEEPQCPTPVSSFFLRSFVPWLRFTLKEAKARTKKSCAGPATRISGAVSVHTFITKFAENCWKGMKGEKAGKRKNWSACKTRIGEEKEKSRYLGDIGWSMLSFFVLYVLFTD